MKELTEKEVLKIADEIANDIIIKNCPDKDEGRFYGYPEKEDWGKILKAIKEIPERRKENPIRKTENKTYVYHGPDLITILPTQPPLQVGHKIFIRKREQSGNGSQELYLINEIWGMSQGCQVTSESFTLYYQVEPILS